MQGKDGAVGEIVLIGDSIRMGYQEVVRRELGAKAEVWAPAENGGNSRNVLAHLEEWVISRRPEVVHLNCGLHDVWRASPAEEPAVPLDEYRANLTEIFHRIMDGTAAVLTWAATTPVNERSHRERKGFDRLEADILAYNRAAAEIAGGLGVGINDLYAAVVRAGPDSLLSDDGVHFAQAGYELLGKAVAEFIRPSLKELG
jgi:lysophospholipase L1-like esterase